MVYPSYGPGDGTIVMRGGFGPAKENVPLGPLKALRQYPPISSIKFDPTFEGAAPKLRIQFICDRAANDSAMVRDETHRNDASMEIPVSEVGKIGEEVAKGINFDRQTWNMQASGRDNFYSTSEMREDFVASIDAGAEFEHCNKCDKKHIPPGPPITLQDRDTCYSYLPEWFPIDLFAEPWDVLRRMQNELLILDEMDRGYDHKLSPKCVSPKEHVSLFLAK